MSITSLKIFRQICCGCVAGFRLPRGSDWAVAERLLAEGALTLTNSRRRALLLSTSLIGLMVVGSTYAADQTYQFDIPAESLGQALTDFSKASSQQIVFSEDTTAGKRAAGIHGRYTADQALRALLSGSGLVAEVNSSGVLMVQPKNAEAASNDGAARLETVVVTGTLLRTAGADAAPVTVIDRAAMKAQGFASPQDAIRSLPSNFAGDINPESSFSQQGGLGNSSLNYGEASAPNLHGLGATATLSLLDGQRLPLGSQGVSADISLMPQIALDRIEVLRDGASPTYGADAVAGVVNFITRTPFDGAETDLRAGFATQGGAQQDQVAQLVSQTWDGGGGLLAYQFDHSSPLTVGDRPYQFQGVYPDFNTVLSQQNQNAIYGKVVQEIGSIGTLTASALYGDRASSSYGLQGADETLRTYNTEQQIYSAEFDADIGGGWRSRSYGQIGVNSLRFGTQVLGTQVFPFNLSVGGHDYTFHSVVDGALFELPAGAVSVAIGGQIRWEDRRFETSSLGRSVYAVFGEINAPLISDSADIPFVQSLTLSAAARYDHYSDFGGTTNPRIGVVWGVVPGLKINGTYSTSFRAPAFFELETLDAESIAYAPFDSLSPTGSTAALFLTGGNPKLKPETSRNYTIGFDYQSAELPGFVANADYYNISFNNRIGVPDPAGALFSDLGNPLFAQYVDRAPTSNQIQDGLSYPIFVNLLSGPGNAGDNTGSG